MTTQQFAQQFVSSNKETSELLLIAGPLWGEAVFDHWIPLTKDQ